MFHNSRLLVYIDQYSNPQPLISKAKRIAANCQLELVLFSPAFNASVQDNSPQHQQARDNIVRQQQLFLNELAEPLAEQGIRCSVQVIWHKQALEAVKEAHLRQPFDLLIKTTEYQNLLQRAFFTHTDWELIRSLKIPVLLCKGNKWSEQMSTVACVDPSHEAESAGHGRDDQLIKIGLATQKITKGSLHLLHVYDPAPVLLHSEQPSLNHGLMMEELQQAHYVQFQELAKRYQIPEDHCHLEVGNVNEVIPEAVYTQGYGLVIMGAHARHGLERFILGHTAERVLDRMTVDILVVPN